MKSAANIWSDEQKLDIKAYECGLVCITKQSPIAIRNTRSKSNRYKIKRIFPDDFKYNAAVDGKGNKSKTLMGDYQMLVRGDLMRGRYRNSFEHPQAFVPDNPERVRCRSYLSQRTSYDGADSKFVVPIG